MPVPGRCCCGNPHCCFEACKKFPRQIEITVTGPTDVYGWCYGDNDDGVDMQDCRDDCNDVRIACLAAIDYGQSPEDQCADKYLCEAAYKTCVEACIDTHISSNRTCPSGAVAGTFILDLVEDESECGSYCTWRVRVPAGDWSWYGGLFDNNCNEPTNLNEDTYFEFTATLTDYDPDDGVTSVEVVCPWGPAAFPISFYSNNAIPDDEFCDGVELALVGDSTYYADIVHYRAVSEDGFTTYDCGNSNSAFSQESGGFDYQCVFTSPTTEWPDLIPADYPGYPKNSHTEILIDPAVTIGGEYD